MTKLKDERIYRVEWLQHILKLTTVVWDHSLSASCLSEMLSKDIPTEGWDPLEEFSFQILTALHTWLASYPSSEEIPGTSSFHCTWLYCAPALAFSKPFLVFTFWDENTSLSFSPGFYIHWSWSYSLCFTALEVLFTLLCTNSLFCLEYSLFVRY